MLKRLEIFLVCCIPLIGISDAHSTPSVHFFDVVVFALDSPKIIFKDQRRLAIENESKKVWKRSLIIPGWSQYTNGGLWWLKVPVIYGGYVAGVLFFDYQNQYYKSYLAEAQYRLKFNHAPPPGSLYQRADAQMTQAFVNAKDNSRRNRDFIVLIIIGWHALNVVEAYVDNMLKNRWSVDRDLKFSMSLEPLSLPTGFETTYAVSLNIKFGF